jgi:hypothetical protein
MNATFEGSNSPKVFSILGEDGGDGDGQRVTGDRLRDGCPDVEMRRTGGFRLRPCNITRIESLENTSTLLAIPDTKQNFDRLSSASRFRATSR